VDLGTATNITNKEVLAAGVLLLSGWDGQGDFQILCVVQGLSLKAAMIAVIFRRTLTVKKNFEKNGTIGIMSCLIISHISLLKKYEFHYSKRF
jgi:putative N6-adenine-specific DNA methylase